MKILVVEDDPSVRTLVKAVLEHNDNTVITAETAKDGQALATGENFEMIVLDLGLPDGDGYEVCKYIRDEGVVTPVLILSGEQETDVKVKCLKVGADDYLTKDISQAQMMVRIVALFRRVDALKAPSDKEDIIHWGKLTINKQRMSTMWDNHGIELTVTEFWIIYALARHPGHVKNRQQLMDAANVVLDDNTITSHIKRIRKKFLAFDSEFSSIETAYGMGYRWKVA